MADTKISQFTAASNAQITPSVILPIIAQVNSANTNLTATLSQLVPTASTTTPGSITLAGDLAGTYSNPSVPGLALKANLNSPTFTGIPLAPTATSGTNNTQISTTAFVASALSAYVPPSATTTTQGILQLTNDLSGTATMPTIAKLNGTTIDYSTRAGGYALTFNSTTNTYQFKNILSNFVETINVEIEYPSVKSYIIEYKAIYAFTITGISVSCSSGSGTFNLAIAGTNVLSLDANFTTANSDLTISTGNVVAIGNQVVFKVQTITSNPTNLAFTITTTRN